jgi:VanZ family protein
MTTTAPPRITPTVATLWLLVALWTALILWAGSDNLSMSNSSRYLVPFLRWLLPDADSRTLWKVIVALRKAAHLIEYAILAWVTWLALFSTFRRALLRFIGLALAWVLVVAAFDEIRQSMVESRTGSIVDVAIDLTGGVLALALAITYTRFMQRKRGSLEAR